MVHVCLATLSICVDFVCADLLGPELAALQHDRHSRTVRIAIVLDIVKGMVKHLHIYQRHPIILVRARGVGLGAGLDPTVCTWVRHARDPCQRVTVLVKTLHGITQDEMPC